MAKRRRSRYQVDLGVQFDGLDELIQTYDNMIDSIDDRLAEGLNEYAALVEEGAKALTFKDYGDLETSINAEPAKWRDGVLQASVGTNLEYALRLHEQPYKPGERPKYDNGIKIDDYYIDGRGRRTRNRPSWRGEEPGRKFLARAVSVTEEDFQEIMAEAYADVLRGRKR